MSYLKSEWQGGVVGNFTITNTGSTAINGWQLAFTFPGDTKAGAGWNAVLTQTGSSVVATNAFYNGSVAPGSSVSFGFQGTWTSNDADPVAYTLNGSPCSIG